MVSANNEVLYIYYALHATDSDDISSILWFTPAIEVVA